MSKKHGVAWLLGAEAKKQPARPSGRTAALAAAAGVAGTASAGAVAAYLAAQLRKCTNDREAKEKEVQHLKAALAHTHNLGAHGSSVEPGGTIRMDDEDSDAGTPPPTPPPTPRGGPSGTPRGDDTESKLAVVLAYDPTPHSPFIQRVSTVVRRAAPENPRQPPPTWTRVSGGTETNFASCHLITDNAKDDVDFLVQHRRTFVRELEDTIRKAAVAFGADDTQLEFLSGNLAATKTVFPPHYEATFKRRGIAMTWSLDSFVTADDLKEILSAALALGRLDVTKMENTSETEFRPKATSSTSHNARLFIYRC